MVWLPCLLLGVQYGAHPIAVRSAEVVGECHSRTPPQSSTTAQCRAALKRCQRARALFVARFRVPSRPRDTGSSTQHAWLLRLWQAACRRPVLTIVQARTSPEMLSHARADGSASGGRGRGEGPATSGGGGRGCKKAPQQSAIEQHYLAELRKFIEEKGAPLKP